MGRRTAGDFMNDDDAPPFDTFPHELYAERREGTGRPLADAARRLAAAISEVLAIAPLDWDVEARPPMKVVPDAFERLLGRLRQGRPFAIADRSVHWSTMLAIQASPLERREYISLALPPRAMAQLADLDQMIELVARCAHELDAHVAFTRDAAIDHAFYGRRAHERNFEQIPPQLRAIVPMEQFERHPALGGDVPQLLVPQELPTDRVPTGVYWINWWGPAIVAELGRERILAVGWARTLEHDDRSLTLVATEQPPDLTDAGDVRKLAAIAEALDLGERQRGLAK
jgi:hypothetical protein